MGLERTPPQIVNRHVPGTPGASTSMVPPGNDSLPSPTSAFAPRNPGVLRSPPAHSTVPSAFAPSPARPPVASSSTPKRVVPDEEDVTMEEEPSPEPATLAAVPPAPKSPSKSPTATFRAIPVASPARPSPARPVPPKSPIPKTDPPAEPTVAHEAPAADAFVTPARSTRPMRKSQPAAGPSVQDTPAIPIPEAEPHYGKRWDITKSTLELAIRAGTQKWTVRDLEQCFPLLYKHNPKVLNDIWAGSCQVLKDTVVDKANGHFEYFKTGPSLQLMEEIVNDAKQHETNGGGVRLDAWRPDLKPEALLAATMLPLYDESYAKLREEYIALHDDCSKRYASIRAKQAELKALESNVSEGVVELNKTLEILDGFPSQDMKVWMEEAAGSLEGRTR